MWSSYNTFGTATPYSIHVVSDNGKDKLVSDQWLNLLFVKLGNRFSLSDWLNISTILKPSQTQTTTTVSFLGGRKPGTEGISYPNFNKKEKNPSTI